ncbi:NAD(P)-dependent oxidoreductase [Gammaproteobacteria bacterium]|nr:NAD(P)-dependent oxidoreductase [Gammaproteobacteria bacterium]
MKNIGWIGLGKMGLPMALKLADQKYNLSVFNRTKSKTVDLVTAGAQAEDNVVNVTKSSDIIITMVSDDIALEKVALNSDGVIANAKPNSTYIDMSTVSPGLSAKISAAAVNKNINYLRAPVNGTVMQAETSTLVILVSGPEEEFEKQKDIFETMGNKIFYTGEEEQARYLKLSINMMVGVSSIMMAEALALGKAGGLDWDLMIDIIKNSAVGSPVVNYKEAMLKDRDFKPAFSAKQMAKDFDLILEAGRLGNVPLSIAAQTRQNWSSMIATGRGEKDFFGYIELLEELSGLKK